MFACTRHFKKSVVPEADGGLPQLHTTQAASKYSNGVLKIAEVLKYIFFFTQGYLSKMKPFV